MDRTRIQVALPYAVLLVAAVLFFVLAGNIRYSQQPGQLGPDLWPKLALGLMVAVCLVEIVRILLGSRAEIQGVVDVLEAEKKEEAPPSRPAILLAGIGLTLAYGVAVPYVGFPIATFLFLVAFMYLGGYRFHVAIWAASGIGTLLFATVFLNVVYVSLPRGVPPFDRVTDAIIALF